MAAGKASGPAIAALATAIYDNRRRGAPRPGCDCVQCFGYCMIDQEVAQRRSFERAAPADATPAILETIRRPT